jgi:hypothetical protein
MIILFCSHCLESVRFITRRKNYPYTKAVVIVVVVVAILKWYYGVILVAHTVSRHLYTHTIRSVPQRQCDTCVQINIKKDI